MVALSVAPAPALAPVGVGPRPEARRRAPVRWSPAELLWLAQRAATEFGRWPELAQPLADRQCDLLERTLGYELWAIRWPQESGLVLHDHGGSSGAFRVVSGTLEETSTTRPGRGPHRRGLHRRDLSAGHSASFGPDYVHGVLNPAGVVATSIHAYSPPLTSLTFYRSTSNGLAASHVETEWDGAP